ncbi:MAG: metallopeptidase family protein [Dehalococcoidia bacterium]
MQREHFEELVRRALEELPPRFAEHLANIEVEVRDLPSREELRATRVGPGHTLLGLYQGIPQTRRGRGYQMVLPDRIIIYQRPIERLCRSDDEVVQRVREVVIHEIAHHFGISDARLREIEGWRRRKQ